MLTHHSWANKPELLWVCDPPPRTFLNLGRIEVLPEDTKSESNSFGVWNSLPLQVLMQWRWDNDRAAVLAEDSRNQRVETDKRAEAARARAAFLAEVTLSKLSTKKLFPTWGDYTPKVAKEGCRSILLSFVRRLNEAANPIPRDLVHRELQNCVEELNRFDSDHDHFIETEEREDILRVFEEILHAAKFPELMDKVDEWRDW